MITNQEFELLRKFRSVSLESKLVILKEVEKECMMESICEFDDRDAYFAALYPDLIGKSPEPILRGARLVSVPLLLSI